jgi:CO/xanthine dehydrogenase FAD-binding subunit
MRAHFGVLRPTTPNQASALKREHGSRARYWAGGTDMILLWQRGLVDLDYCIDLSRVRGLDAIDVSPWEIRIGARVTLAQIERAAAQHRLLRTLSDVTKLMCTPQSRTLATIGGNLCNASPAADLSPVLVTLDAKCSATAAFRFSIFLLNAFVSLVKRRTDILIVRFWRSTKLVDMWASSGAPAIGIRSALIT